MIDENNCLAKYFRRARDHYETVGEEFAVKLVTDKGKGKEYDLPGTSEVAGLIVGYMSSTIGERDIVGYLEKASEGGSGARPCSTLFIANLGPNCTEDELKQLLSRYSGFNILKIRARGGMPVAFADFEEIEQATYVMNDLQGNLLSSSDRGGMHIE
ncbi:hypothetical protein F2Q70_00023496 [Brassica cretica]|uniref:RRM domain-containing protein n=1 Tax=Brassica cretica TaxID=69181 RepID=A0A8S9GG43_BRACR|nr:hypothetical protein F2Q70_00023496 [Brassica cretica]